MSRWNPLEWLPWALYVTAALGMIPALLSPWWGRGMWFRVAYALKPVVVVLVLMPEFVVPGYPWTGSRPGWSWPWLEPLNRYRLWLAPGLGGMITLVWLVGLGRWWRVRGEWSGAMTLLTLLDVLRWGSALLCFVPLMWVVLMPVAVLMPVVAALGSLVTLGEARGMRSGP